MNRMPVQGTFAAVLTPRTISGDVDLPALERSLSFLMDRGIRGVALNGATGEFCATTLTEFSEIMTCAARVTNTRAALIAGIGSGSLRNTLTLKQIAQSCGAAAVLLPMPYFFHYSQQDLAAYCEVVAGSLDVPILLYNLPQFSSGLEPETLVKLLSAHANIVGLKDSSGQLDSLQRLTDSGFAACRVIGNDSALHPALQQNLCDGVISGVAGVLPELISALYRAGKERDSDRLSHYSERLGRFIARLEIFPVPWGLKVIAEMRGIAAAHYLQPLSSERHEQIAGFRKWFEQNREDLLVDSSPAPS